MMFAGGPIVGKLYDNFGPRYILLIGSFLHVFGLMMASVSTEYYQIILAQGICSPIGASAVFYPSMNAVGTWFFRHRALAFGIIAAGSSLGGVILPIMIQHLIPKIGFPWTMRVIAFTVLGLLIIANLTVKSRIPPTRKPFAFMDFVRPLQELPFMLVVLACLFIFFGSFIPINFAILEARQFGMSVELSSYLLAILNAVSEALFFRYRLTLMAPKASLFGRTIPGHLGDVFGRFNVTIIFTFMTAIVVLALWIPARDNAPMIVFAALYGFGNGSFVSMAPALIAQISDIRQLGVRTGTLFAVVSIGALCGNPIGGALLSQDGGGYLYLQIFCGTFLLAGAITFLAARWALVKWKLQVKV
jgi:MFS family permease